MRSAGSKIVLSLVLLGTALALGLAVQRRIAEHAAASAAGTDAPQAAPVEVAAIERGEVVLRRTFSGALEAAAEFVVASKVGGRLERIDVDLGDPVQRGQEVVRLDDDEHLQAVHQAEAELEVARANATEAESALENAERSLERIGSLNERGMTSESELDATRAEKLAQEARLAVTRAQITRAEAALATARIRLEYTRVTADWSGGDDERVVAQRFVDEGETVSPNEALLTIVELDPSTGVFHVPERDYARLRIGQEVSLTTQAWPDDRFHGTIARIAPVFQANTRQARVEVTLPNPDRRLKPGMFVRATVELDRARDATIVPADALTERADQPGVFVVAADGRSVAWRPVTLGIREEGRVQVAGEGLEGRVVTLGQQLVEDGSAILIPDEESAGDEAPDAARGAPGAPQ
jgi:RND family efflux transporter MFP subunit